jgi:hypothetical protein
LCFDEIVQDVMNKLNLTDNKSRERVGGYVNDRYKRVTSGIGLITSRRTIINLDVDPTDLTDYPNLPEIQVNGLEKVERVWTLYDTSSPNSLQTLKQLTYEELTSRVPYSDVPRCWAVKLMGPGVVTIVVDGTPTTAYPLSLEGYAIAPVLSGDLEPFFPTDFHDILVEGAKADELWKMEKATLAQAGETKYEGRLSDLRMFIAKSAWLDIAQGKDKPQSLWYRPGFQRIVN